MTSLSGAGVSGVSVDPAGLSFRAKRDLPVDVLFDGRRIWSFWTLRDTERRGGLRQRYVEWPAVLASYLDGTAQVTVTEHVSGHVLWDDRLSFGSGAGTIEFKNAHGAPMGIDKSGRLTATFDSRSADDVDPLLDAIGETLAALRRAGVEAFPGYGTLLGAVREKDFLGHDSDADLCYVSQHDRPVDVCRESFQLERSIREQGHHTYRYSGAAFRIDVTEGDGTTRGLDVFAGFIDEGVLYLMGEVGTPFEMSWIFPLGECELAGRTFPAPAVPEKLLEAMYGPGWRVPDPAFKFETSEHVQHQLNGWFRGTRTDRAPWERLFSGKRHELPRRDGSDLARLVDEQTAAGVRVLDVGAGRCADAMWLAGRGRPVTAFEVVPHASLAAQAWAAENHAPLEVRRVNLLEWRSTLGQGAQLAHEPGPRVMMARNLVDAVPAFGRDAFGRFARMALSGQEGNRLYVEVWTGEGVPQPRLTPVKLERLAKNLRRRGATIVSEEHFPVGASKESAEHSIGRLVAQWD